MRKTGCGLVRAKWNTDAEAKCEVLCFALTRDICMFTCNYKIRKNERDPEVRKL